MINLFNRYYNKTTFLSAIAILLAFSNKQSYTSASQFPEETSSYNTVKILHNNPTIFIQKRSKELQDEIDRSFLNLQNSAVDREESVKESKALLWGYNGAKKYFSPYYDEHALIMSEIIRAQYTEKDIWVMDIGGGDFSWGTALSSIINDSDLIEPTTKVHIVNLRGEVYKGKEVVVKDKCIFYNFGSFKVENLIDELIKRKISVHTRFQAIITRFCLTHLVDPLGTFFQAYSLLKPRSGIMMTDSFQFLTEETVVNRKNRGSQLVTENLRPLFSLFYEMKASFVAILGNNEYITYGIPFIIRGNGNIPDQKTITYAENNLTSENIVTQHFKSAIFNYRFVLPKTFFEYERYISKFLNPPSSYYQNGIRDVLTNDKILGGELIKKCVFKDNVVFSFPWSTAKKADDLLHEAIQKNSLETMLVAFANGACVNSVNRLGKTPLENAMSGAELSFEIIETILKNNPIITEKEKNKYLFMALKSNNITVAKLFIDLGADVNSKIQKESFINHFVSSSMCHANTIEFLIDQGANTQEVIFDNALYHHSSDNVAKLLINKGIKVSDLELSLYRAIKRNSLELVNIFVKKGAKVNHFINGISLLDHAINNTSIEIIQALVNNGAHVKPVDIHHARDPQVKVLLQQKLNK